MVTFFGLNGLEFEPPEVEAAVTMLRLAAGEITEAEFITWVREHARQRP
jgi:death-on-curing protein